VTPLTTELSPELARGIDQTAELLAGRSVAVLTGAGVSTDSGIPDYRGEGAPKRSPMTFQQFLSDDRYRKRYWAGSHLGYRRFAAARPNDGHRALAALEASGATNGVITQNVDGLHKQAGSQRVVDLHGAMDRVLCLVCGQIFAREAITARIDAANPWLDTEGAVEIAPDGDAIVTDIDAFVVPDCTVCGGHLKPDVVGDDARRIECARQRAGVDGVEPSAGECAARRLGLRASRRVQRDVAGSLDALGEIPVGLAVPHQRDEGHTRPFVAGTRLRRSVVSPAARRARPVSRSSRHPA